MKNEQHNGQCGFCKTTVPLDATVCTGCGAMWGFSNGLNRREQYKAFIGKYRLGQLIFFGSLLAMLFAYYNVDGAEALGWWALSIVAFLTGLNIFIGAWQQIQLAKKGELSWWRTQT